MRLVSAPSALLLSDSTGHSRRRASKPLLFIRVIITPHAAGFDDLSWLSLGPLLNFRTVFTRDFVALNSEFSLQARWLRDMRVFLLPQPSPPASNIAARFVDLQ